MFFSALGFLNMVEPRGCGMLDAIGSNILPGLPKTYYKKAQHITTSGCGAVLFREKYGIYKTKRKQY